MKIAILLLKNHESMRECPGLKNLTMTQQDLSKTRPMVSLWKVPAPFQEKIRIKEGIGARERVPKDGFVMVLRFNLVRVGLDLA